MRAKISNFNLLRVETTDHSTTYHATIDVTTGHWWWKKTQTLDIFRSRTDNWRRADNGDYIRHPAVKNLARVWTLKTGEEC